MGNTTSNTIATIIDALRTKTTTITRTDAIHELPVELLVQILDNVVTDISDLNVRLVC